MIESTPFVIDGDTTYSKQDGKRRLHGINTPELSHTDDDFTAAGGEEASARLKQLLDENPDAIWESISYDSKYGRDVGRYVTKDGTDLNEKLVREGHATTMDFKGERSPYHMAELQYVRDLEDDKEGVLRTQSAYVPYEQKNDRSLAQELGEGVARGIDQTQGLLGYGISALARSIGMDSLSEYGEELAEKNFTEAQEHAATIGSYKDISFDDDILKGLTDSAHYVTGIIGEQIPQIGFDLFAGLATGGVGAVGSAAIRKGVTTGIMGAAAKAASKSGVNVGMFGSMTTQQIGEVEAELRQNGVDAPLTSIVGGLGAGAIDFLGAKVLLKTVKNFYQKGNALQGKEILAAGLANTALEGTTEGIQTLMAKGAVLYEKTGYDMFSEENMEEVINAVIAGAIIGSAPAVAATGAAFVRNGINKISGGEIERQNQQIIGAEQTRSEVFAEAEAQGLAPEAVPSVTTRAKNSEGETVEIGQETVSPNNVDKVTKKFESLATDAGFFDIETIISTAKDTVESREGEISQDNDHYIESIEQVEDQFRAFKDGGKPVVYTQPEGFKNIVDKFPNIIREQDLYAVTDQGGNAAIVKGSNQAEAVAQTMQGRQPEIHKMTEFLPETHTARREVEEKGLNAIPFDPQTDNISDTENAAALRDEEDDVRQESLEREAAAEDEVVEETVEKRGPSAIPFDPQTDNISDTANAATLRDEEDAARQESLEREAAADEVTGKNANAFSDETIAKTVDDQMQQQEDEKGVPNIVPDSVIKANKEAEALRVSKFTLDSKGVPVAPKPKAKTGVQTLGQKEKNLSIIRDAATKISAVTEEEDSVPENTARVEGVDNTSMRDKFMKDVVSVGIETYAQRHNMNVENLADAIEKMVGDTRTPDGVKAVMDEALGIYRRKHPLPKNKGRDSRDSEPQFDDAHDKEVVNDLAEIDTDADAGRAFSDAAAAGIKGAKDSYHKQLVRDTDVDDYADAGYKTREAFFYVQKKVNSLIKSAIKGDIKDLVYAGKKGEDLSKVMSRFGKIGDGGELTRVVEFYMPDVLRHLNENLGSRFDESGSSSFETRAVAQYAEFIDHLYTIGYIPMDFNSDPSKTNETAHIAYTPSYTSKDAPYTLKELGDRMRTHYTDTGSDSGDFFALGQEQELQDAFSTLESATERVMRLVDDPFMTDSATLEQAESIMDALQEAYDNLLVKQEEDLIEHEAQQRLNEAEGQTPDTLADNMGRDVDDPVRTADESRHTEGKKYKRSKAEQTEYNRLKAKAKREGKSIKQVQAENKAAAKARAAKASKKDNFSGTVEDKRIIRGDNKNTNGSPKTLGERISQYVQDISQDAGLVSPIGIAFDAAQKTVATVTFNSGKATITFNKDMFEKLMNESPEAAAHVIAHEVGHVFTAETLHNAPKDVLAGLHKSFRKVRETKEAGHPYLRRKGVGFDEWMADQFAIHVNKPVGTKDTVDLMSKIINGLKKIVNHIAPLFGVERLDISYSGQAFMESAFRSGVKGTQLSNSDFARSLQAMNLEFGGNYPHSRAEERRFMVENKALGKKTDNLAESKVSRDFNLGQNLNRTSDLGRAAINAVGQAGRSVITDPKYIPKQASKLVGSVRKGAPMFFTAANELKHIRGGRRIAKMYRDMFDNTVADSALWQNEATAVLKNVDKKELEDFIKGKAGLPQSINAFMNKYHKFLARNMPTLGYIKGYFPRAYDVQYIEQNRDAFEEFLLDQAVANKVKGFDEASAKAAVDSILDTEDGSTGMPEVQPVAFGSDPFSQKTRVLEFVSDEDLRAKGFLRSDVDNVLSSYVHRMAHRANFEKQFSGYTSLIGDKNNPKDAKDSSGNSKKAKARFTKKLFLSFPFKTKDGRLMSYDEKDEAFGAADEDFFNRNKARFAEANANKWIIKNVVKTEDGIPISTWDYYDKNQQLRATYEGISDPSDKIRYSKIVDALEGRIGARSLSPRVRDAMSAGIAYQNWTILLFSGFSQLAEISGLIFRNRDLEGAFAALQEMGKLIAGQDRAERRALYNDMGFAQKQLANQAILEGMGVNYQSPFAQKVNNFLFKANGMNFITNASRVMGAAIAEKFIQRHGRKAANGDKRSQRYLDELGLTQEQAMYADSANYVPYSEFVALGDITSDEAIMSEAVHKAMFKFVDGAVVRPNATQRPVWGSDPRWMMVWHLKSFMYAYGSTILGGLSNEVQARYKESGSKLDAALPLLVYAIPMLMMSGLALELREFIQYKLFGLGSKPYSDGVHGADYIMELVSRGGALGPMEMGYSFVEDEQKGRSAITGLLGPTVQQLGTILEFDLDKTVNRSIPVLSQNPAFKEWVNELLN